MEVSLRRPIPARDRSRRVAARPRRGQGAPGNGWRAYAPGRWSEDYTWVGRRHRHHHHRRSSPRPPAEGACAATRTTGSSAASAAPCPSPSGSTSPGCASASSSCSIFTGVAVLPYALAWLLIPMRGRGHEHLPPRRQRPARHPPAHRARPGAHRGPVRRELPAPRFPRVHRVAQHPGRRHRRPDLAQRRRVRAHLPARRHRPARRPGHRRAGPPRRRDPGRRRRARRAGRARPCSSWTTLHAPPPPCARSAGPCSSSPPSWSSSAPGG